MASEEIAHPIAILHRKKSSGVSQPVSDSLIDTKKWVHWETCLREMFFASTAEISPEMINSLPADIDVYMGEEAYNFCLQTVCGLKSPMIGETEVWGQFKALFRDFPFSEHPSGKVLQSFIQCMFSDAKWVRHQHLTGLGSQSYGSLARKLLRGSREINIIGGGLLVKDMLPWLKKDVGQRNRSIGKSINTLAVESSKIQLFCRRAEQAAARISELRDGPGKEVSSVKGFSLEELSIKSLSGSLIIAAPVSREWLEENIKNHSLEKIIDLRDNSDKDSLEKLGELSDSCEVIPLSHFFKEIEGTKERLKNTVIAANEEIKDLIAKRFYPVKKSYNQNKNHSKKTIDQNPECS